MVHYQDRHQTTKTNYERMGNLHHLERWIFQLDSIEGPKGIFPTETAMYAVEKGIDKEPAFAWWVSHTLRRKDRSIKKVKSKYWERTHKYGIQIPKTVEEALRIDKENGDHLWGDAIKMEMTNNRVAFEEFGGDVSKLVGYKRITAHLIFDVKLGENFRRKAMLQTGTRLGRPQQ